MKRLLIAIAGALLGAFFSPSAAWAQEFSWATHVYQVLDAEQKFFARSIAPRPGYLSAAVLGVSEVDMRNGYGGTAVGVYGAASAKNSGTSGQREIVGVYGRVDKQGQVVGIGVHSECWETTPPWLPGGQCILFNGEMQATSPGGQYIGLNLHAKPETRDIVGIQLQDTAPAGETNFRRLTQLPPGWHSIGFVDGIEFCMRFTGRSQLQQWVRGAPLCDSPDAIVVHEINVGWRPGAPLANR